MLTVVIPAFNEEKLLARCLCSVRTAFAAAPEDQEYEIVVCDNRSSDGTAALAGNLGARVVFEPLNRISAARNTGAAAARGEWLIFLDADSVLSPATLGAAQALMRSGACAGGGAVIGAADPCPPLWGILLMRLWNFVSVSLRLAAGSFLFCRRDAFTELGGFSPRLYAGEELQLSRALRRWGAARGLGFAIITSAPHISSGRKYELYTFAELMAASFRFMLNPFGSARNPERLGVFYEGRR